jgi:hypothetical protein
MPTEKEIVVVQKATAYDLLEIIRENPGKTYTQEEIEQLIRAYIKSIDR